MDEMRKTRTKLIGLDSFYVNNNQGALGSMGLTSSDFFDKPIKNKPYR